MSHRAVIVPLIATIVLATAPGALACWAPKSSERKLATLTNRTRHNNDRSRLSFSDALSKAARVHSRRMARRGYLFHNTLSSFESLLGGSWNSIGENVGYGARIRQIHRAFMRSAGHRDNILNAGWRKLGVGTVKKGGSLWVTVLFSDAGRVRAKVGSPSC